MTAKDSLPPLRFGECASMSNEFGRIVGSETIATGVREFCQLADSRSSVRNRRQTPNGASNLVPSGCDGNALPSVMKPVANLDDPHCVHWSRARANFSGVASNCSLWSREQK